MSTTFVSEPIIPEDASFSVSSMAGGAPGLPASFSWRKRSIPVLEVREAWKQSGACRHGSGERYVRKHWFRIRTTEDREMTIYFERQAQSRSRARWRLYSFETRPANETHIETRPVEADHH